LNNPCGIFIFYDVLDDVGLVPIQWSIKEGPPVLPMAADVIRLFRLVMFQGRKQGIYL
jgi:hypothetical protein